MSQHSLQWHPCARDVSWLSMLVASFEKTSQTDLRALPCDEPVLLALKAQLARPILPRSSDGSDFQLLN